MTGGAAASAKAAVLLVVLLGAAPVAVSSTASVQSGSLVQLSGTTGCITTASTSACVQSPLLAGVHDVKVSPDGLNVYVASTTSNAVVVFRRDPATGGLMPLPGAATCVSETGSNGFCAKGRDLKQPVALALSSDGRFLYVVSRGSNGIAIFRRNLSAGSFHGGLQQLSGAKGCMDSNGTSACSSAGSFGLFGAQSIAADGSFFYVASPARYGGGVSAYREDPATGALTYLGCLARLAGCTPFVDPPTTPTATPVAVGVAGGKLLIGALYQSAGKTYPALFQTLITSAGTFDVEPVATDPCFGAAAAPLTGCDAVLGGTAAGFSFSSTADQRSVFVGVIDSSLRLDPATGSENGAAVLYDFGSKSAEARDAFVTVAGSAGSAVSVVSSDGQRVYTEDDVLCRSPTAFYQLSGTPYYQAGCADVRYGPPLTRNRGVRLVTPTAMAISADGTSVYATYATSALGGIAVLRPVP